MKLFLSFVIVFASLSSHAAESKKSIIQHLKILSYDELGKLEPDTRTQYIIELRKLMVDLANIQNRDGMTYSAESDTTAGLIIRIFAEVMADWKTGQKCVFAGHVSETYEKKASDGSAKIVCKFPKMPESWLQKCDPSKGLIACNPGLYKVGNNQLLCVKIDNNSTSNCANNPDLMKAEDIAKFIATIDKQDFKDLKKEWNDYAQQFRGACTNNTQQSTVCKTSLARIDEIHAKLNLPATNSSSRIFEAQRRSRKPLQQTGVQELGTIPAHNTTQPEND